nr:MAG TPA: hypothetical protein [Caudoviricetes sp.]
MVANYSLQANSCSQERLISMICITLRATLVTG